MRRAMARRGRPKATREQHDAGTPELQRHRTAHATAEALDLCLARDIITAQQHWCGIHLRWLYTLRYGAPGVRATDYLHFGGNDLADDDPQWRASREAEYIDAMQTLGQRLGSLLLRVTVYNERPSFLRPAYPVTAHSLRCSERETALLREGLDRLVALWYRK